jgi:putative tricarboxylic transport membrane protein
MWIVLGMFAVPQLMGLTAFKNTMNKLREEKKMKIESPWAYYSLAVRQIKNYIGMILRGSAIGTVIGIIPGIGSLTAGWMAYSMADRFAKKPELIGQGSLEAIACIESSNNAALPGALIPMFSLGIPGSGTAAIIMSVFMVAGLSPGPMMMERSGNIIWSIMFGCMSCGIAVVLESYPCRVACGAMRSLPMHWLLVLLGPLVMTGAFVTQFDVFSINVMMGVALLSVFLTYLKVPSIGVLLGVILGRMIEAEMLRAYQVGGIGRFIRPFPIALILLILLVFFVGVYNAYFKKNENKNKLRSLRMVGQGDDEEYEDEEGEELVRKRDPEIAKNTDVYQRLLFSLFLICVGIWGFSKTGSFAPMARLWPRLLFVLFFFLPCAILLTQVAFRIGRLPAYFKNKQPITKGAKANLIEQIVVYVALFFCGNMVSVLGFVLCCALFAFIITWFMNPKKPHLALISCAVIGVFMWMMNLFCQFNLPKGPLGI